MMNRDELILSSQPTVKNLVRKYNNYNSDEDLEQTGMVAVCECVDRCLVDRMTDPNQIQARCNVWAKNKILDTIYARKLKIADDDLELLPIADKEDLSETIVAVEQELTPRQKEMFKLMLDGYSQEQIMKKMNINRSMYFAHSSNIKKVLQKLNMDF